jgi:hypothetical protein
MLPQRKSCLAAQHLHALPVVRVQVARRSTMERTGGQNDLGFAIVIEVGNNRPTYFFVTLR